LGRGLFGRISRTIEPRTALGGLDASLADTGLRDALRIGVDAVVGQLGVPGGFWQDGKIRIPLPGSLERVRKNLSPFGLAGSFDELHAKINEGAEKAVPVGKDLLLGAVSDMSVDDAVSIVRGPDTAATVYLQEKMGDGLGKAFRPLINDALSQTGSMKMVDGIARKYSFGGLGGQAGQGLRDQLSSHVVDRTLSGLFYYVGEQEKNIRANPYQFASKTVQQVFGNR
jgi:hypothetical protein